MLRPPSEIEITLQAMKKVELHVHIEGGIAPEILFELARKNNISLPANSIAELRDWFAFTGFPHFGEIYSKIKSCLLSPEDIEIAAYGFFRNQALENIIHTEATYTPCTVFARQGIPFDEQIDAIWNARSRVAREFGTSSALIVDIPRCSCTLDEAIWTAEGAIRANSAGKVDALGLGGDENGFPPEMYIEPFRLAHESDLTAICHAGEMDGPSSIRGAIDLLHSVRIGHGVRCFEDTALVAQLLENQTHLEVCPSSNICLKVFDDFASHPLPQMIAMGLNVSINSDDPPMFSTTLSNELKICHDSYGLSLPLLAQLQINAARNSLASPQRKAEMEQQLRG